MIHWGFFISAAKKMLPGFFRFKSGSTEQKNMLNKVIDSKNKLFYYIDMLRNAKRRLEMDLDC